MYENRLSLQKRVRTYAVGGEEWGIGRCERTAQSPYYLPNCVTSKGIESLGAWLVNKMQEEPEISRADAETLVKQAESYVGRWEEPWTQTGE